MALSDQQFTFGRAGASAYSPGDVVLANAAQEAHLIGMTVSGDHIVGLTLGVGVTAGAWADGVEIKVNINGKMVLNIMDELCTLLDKEFFPLDIPANADIDVYCLNKGAADIKAAVFLRIESL